MPLSSALEKIDLFIVLSFYRQDLSLSNFPFFLFTLLSLFLFWGFTAGLRLKLNEVTLLLLGGSYESNPFRDKYSPLLWGLWCYNTCYLDGNSALFFSFKLEYGDIKFLLFYNLSVLYGDLSITSCWGLENSISFFCPALSEPTCCEFK